MKRKTRSASALLLGLASLLRAHAAVASPSADELVREAHAHEAAHEDDLALRRYTEAIALDPTLGDAYLGLGALRLHLGDAREAERVFDNALSHLPGLTAAKLGRGHARRALGAMREADADLEAYASSTGDVAALRELAKWYAEEGLTLAELAVWRRLLALSDEAHDATLHKEARLTVHALEIIVGTCDPVRHPPGETTASPVRRGIARADGRR